MSLRRAAQPIGFQAQQQRDLQVAAKHRAGPQTQLARQLGNRRIAGGHFACPFTRGDRSVVACEQGQAGCDCQEEGQHRCQQTQARGGHARQRQPARLPIPLHGRLLNLGALGRVQKGQLLGARRVPRRPVPRLRQHGAPVQLVRWPVPPRPGRGIRADCLLQPHVLARFM